MIVNRPAALVFIAEDEGPEVNVSPDEPGGISCRGVTLIVLGEYNKEHGLPPAVAADVAALTQDLADKVYIWRFLDPIRFNDLPSGIDYRMADSAITLGLSGSCIAVQMALALWPVTGVMDDATIAAIKAEDPKLVIAALDAAWITWKHGMTPTGWAKYGHGWTLRVRRVRDRALAMLTV